MVTYREDALQLRAIQFQYRRHGTAVLTLPWLRVGVHIHPTCFTLLWCWYGKRHHQVVRRVSRLLVECPSCGRRCARLYCADPTVGFLCYRCAGLKLKRWRRNGYDRVPVRPEAWLKWLERQVAKSAKAKERGADGTKRAERGADA